MQLTDLHENLLIMGQLTWAQNVRIDEFVFRPCKESGEECQMAKRKI